MIDQRLRKGIDLMLRIGGSFERALANAAIEHGDGHEFIRCLVAAHKVAYDDERHHLEECFTDCGIFWPVGWAPSDRLQFLLEAFPSLFERHITMAEAAA